MSNGQLALTGDCVAAVMGKEGRLASKGALLDHIVEAMAPAISAVLRQQEARYYSPVPSHRWAHYPGVYQIAEVIARS